MIGGDYLIKCKIQNKYFLFGLMRGLTFGLFFSNTPFGHVNATGYCTVSHFFICQKHSRDGVLLFVVRR
jgi:hypothetical protein